MSTKLHTVNFAEAKPLLIDCLQAGLVPILTGPPGGGKSTCYREICDEFNLEMIDCRLTEYEPTDFNGFPDNRGKKATYLPMDTFPLVGDPLPPGKDGWMLLLDEFTSGDRNTLKATYKPLLDHMVGNHKLHPNLVVAAAGNRIEDNAIVEEIGTALQSRMIHFEMRTDPKNWLLHAKKKGYDYRITSYIEHRPNHLNTFDPMHVDKTFACERTWEFADKLLKTTKATGSALLKLIGGAVSYGIAAEFLAFADQQSKLPTSDDIVKRPESAKVPNEPGPLYLLCGSISSFVDADSIKPVMKYVARLPREFQAVTMRNVILAQPDLETAPEVCAWMMKFGGDLW